MANELVPSKTTSPTKDSAEVPAMPLSEVFHVADRRLVLDADGWYLLVGQTAQRVTVDAAG
jgi:hypothetical protein